MITIHASCVVLCSAADPFGAPRDAGILLLGESGSGKSDLALRLIERGAKLVSDDRTEVFADDEALVARPPATLAGLIEVRNAGVLEFPFVYRVRVALAVDLTEKHVPERLPEREWYQPEGIALAAEAKPPLIRLAAAEASAPAKVIAAAAAHAKGLFREMANPV